MIPVRHGGNTAVNLGVKGHGDSGQEEEAKKVNSWHKEQYKPCGMIH